MSGDFGVLMSALGSFFCGVIAGLALYASSLHGDKEDCEKDLPRTQECTLQWVKLEVSK